MVAQAGICRIVYAQSYANLEHKDIWHEHANLFDEVIELPYDPLYDRGIRRSPTVGIRGLPLWIRKILWKIAGTP
jgi:hypothetical protein